MAFDLGSAVLWLKGDSSQLDKTLNDSEQKSKGWTSSVGGFLGNAFSFVAGGLITRGIDAVTGSIGGMIGGMVNGNAEFEGYNTRFATMLGSADAAKDRMAELADFGASTPFDLPGVVEADIVLQGFGLHSEEALKKFKFSGEEIRTIAGDVASGTGSDFKEMALLIGKFSSGATGEAISRMQELGITNRDELTEMGLRFSKSGQLLSPLPESMEVVLKLMKDKYGGLMDAQSSTFNGMMSNLQDWFAGTLRTIGQPLFEVLKDKLGVLIAFLSSPEVQATITNLSSMLADGLGQAIDWLSNDGIPALINAWNTLAPPIGFIIGVVMGIIDAFNQGGGSATDFSFIIGQASTLIQGVIEGLQLVVGAALAQIAIFWANNGTEITEFVTDAWYQIKAIVSDVLDLLQATIVPMLKGIAAFIGSHTAEIQALLSGAWTVISSVIQGALNIVQGIIRTVLAIVRGDWEGAWLGIQQVLEGVLGIIQGLIKGGMEEAKAIFSMAVDAFIGIANSLGANISKGVGDGIKNVGAAVMDAIGDVVEAAINWAKKKLGIESPSKRAAQVLGEPIAQGIAMGIRNAIGLVVDAASDLGEKTLDTLKDFADKASDLVSRMLDSGLKGKSSLARTKIDYMDAGDDLDKELAETRAKLEARVKAGGEDGKLAAIILAGTPTSYKAQFDQDAKTADEIAKTDPAKAAEFLEMRKKQAIEDMELRKQYAEAETFEQRKAIQDRMNLLVEAHRAEMALYELHEADNTNGIKQLVDDIGGIKWDDPNGIADALATAIRDALEGANIGGGDTFQVNAQGSMWTRQQLEQIIKDAVDARAREAATNNRNR